MSTKICTQCGREYDATQKFCPEDGSVLRGAAGSGDLVGQVVAERYHVLKKLGEGGMGQVYLAEHVRMGRKSALKVMSPHMMSDPDAISRFNREAANACQINHPHIAAVYDFGETSDGLIFLAMEFVDGESLSSLIERHHALPAHRAAEIARQVGDALSAAHEIGIVHRDLKPDNIMITRSRDGADVVKVVDFGIAKGSRGGDSQKVTRTGWIVGTPEYMSPEQLAGDPVDSRSDVYALGLVAFNMFTGQLPFPAKTSKEAMIARLTENPRTLAEMKGDTPWPAGLQLVLNRALARDAEERYFSAREFGRDVVSSLASMPNMPVDALGTSAQESRELQRMINSGAGPASGVRAGQMANTRAAAPLPMSATGVRPSQPTTIARPVTAPSYTPGGTAVQPPPARANRSALVAGIGIAVVLMAGAAAFYARSAGTGAASAAADSPAVVAQGPALAGGAAAGEPGIPATGNAPVAPPTDAPASAPLPAPSARPPAQPPRGAEQRPPAGSPRASAQAAAPNIAAPSSSVPAQSPATVASSPQPAPVERRPDPEPAPSAPAAPAFDRAAAAQEIRGAVGRFVAAFETRRIDEVRRVYPGMSAESANRWQALLGERSVSELKTNVARVGTPEFDGDEAEVAFAMALSFKAGGKVQASEIPYTARLRREGGAWRIASLTGR